MDRLIPESSLLLVIDVQQRLAEAMPEASRARLVKNAEVLLETARVLQIRVVASEQYPKGLGPTIEPIRTRLFALGALPLAKLEFDACGDLDVARAIGSAAPRSVVVIGMETHVCVFQTVRELMRRRYNTFVVADAVASRTEENRAAGLALCERAGAEPL